MDLPGLASTHHTEGGDSLPRATINFGLRARSEHVARDLYKESVSWVRLEAFYTHAFFFRFMSNI